MNQAQGQIQTQLQRRADLIPNLVNTVKGVTKQEDTVFISIANARARLGGAIQSGNVAQMAAAERGADPGARPPARHRRRTIPSSARARTSAQLQDQLEGTENRIAVARQDYNAAVGEYNAYIRRFPYNLTAKMFGHGQAARVLRGRAGVGGAAEGEVLRRDEWDGEDGEDGERRTGIETRSPRCRSSSGWPLCVLSVLSVRLRPSSVRHHMFRQHVLERIHRAAVHVHLVVQVRAGGEAGVAHQRDALAAGDPLAGLHQELGGVGELGDDAVAVVDA